ncbi:hypothetical protein DdX_20496 [Ditylenchus destructor]|uniref:Uncharacterized protein n=1 Tax=Ditylenchus destructor TaxID=166010 RepID=A0AAD4QWH5_9BILA|nr:hypothetical protein DdX_20496 [Ditylenchus destructor]
MAQRTYSTSFLLFVFGVQYSEANGLNGIGQGILRYVFGTAEYLACKPNGEMSISFDGYASSLEIALMWLSMWACIGGLYKMNTGRWPPNPFRNDDDEDEEIEEEEPTPVIIPKRRTAKPKSTVRLSNPFPKISSEPLRDEPDPIGFRTPQSSTTNPDEWSTPRSHLYPETPKLAKDDQAGNRHMKSRVLYLPMPLPPNMSCFIGEKEYEIRY